MCTPTELLEQATKDAELDHNLAFERTYRHAGNSSADIYHQPASQLEFNQHRPGDFTFSPR
jgi:hypothetical protein